LGFEDLRISGFQDLRILKIWWPGLVAKPYRPESANP
jgi:hypothetical protein